MRLLWALAFSAAACWAQQQANPDEIIAIPNRPTISNPAETTQRGVLEIEYGVAASGHQQSTSGLLKFGLTRNLELRWGGDTLDHDAATHTIGVGDTTLGLKYRFLQQSRLRPDIAIGYTASFPTAAGSLGSGFVDHQLTGLFSKDIGKSHLDFNLNYDWFGRSGSGHDQDTLSALAWSRPVKGKFGVTAEISGESSRNRSNAGNVENLYAVTYTVKPRLVLDGGVSFGITGPVPRATLLAGFTYSIVDLYRAARHR